MTATPKGRLRAWLERRLGRFYEGPEPPPRYAAEAETFGAIVDATSEQWVMFAAELAATAYREGYIRGLEHAERARTGVGPDPAEAEAEARAAALQEAVRTSRADPDDPWAALPAKERLNAIRGLAIATGAMGPEDLRNPGSGEDA